MMENNKKRSNSISLVKLLTNTINIIKKDYIIITPYLILFFLLHSFEQSFFTSFSKAKTSTYLVFIITWLAELFFKSLTFSMAIDLVNLNRSSVSASIRTVLKRFVSLVLAAGALSFIVFLLISPLLFKQSSGLINNFVFVILISFVVLFVSFMLEFLPVFILAKNNPWYRAISNTFMFIKNNFKRVFMLMMFIFLVILVNYFLSALFEQIPLLGKAIFQIIVQGISSAFICVLAVVFFYEIEQMDTKTVEGGDSG
ncbi:hypothetical protein ACFLZV_05420 [Candidatus Margulisiibacteriota bacterium]